MALPDPSRFLATLTFGEGLYGIGTEHSFPIAFDFAKPQNVERNLENYDQYTIGANERGQDQVPSVYFHHVPSIEGWEVYEYWLYYADNDFISNKHEHDWEWYFVYLSQGNPVQIGLSAHGQTFFVPWQNVPKDGDHPLLGVEAGSHALSSVGFGGVRTLENGVRINHTGLVLRGNGRLDKGAGQTYRWAIYSNDAGVGTLPFAQQPDEFGFSDPKFAPWFTGFDLCQNSSDDDGCPHPAPWHMNEWNAPPIPNSITADQITVKANKWLARPGQSIVFTGTASKGGAPAPAVRVGVDDPITLVCWLGPTTDGNGEFSFSVSIAPGTPSGLYTFSFYVAGVAPVYVTVTVDNEFGDRQIWNGIQVTVGSQASLDNNTLVLTDRVPAGVLTKTPIDQALSTAFELAGFMGDWTTHFGQSFVTNPVNDVAAVGAVSCLAPEPTLSKATCAAIGGYVVVAGVKTAVTSLLDTIVDRSNGSPADKEDAKAMVQSANCIASYLTIDPTSALASYISTNWTCGSALFRIVRNTDGQVTRVDVAGAPTATDGLTYGISVVLPDSSPPTIPTNLTATAISSSRIDLSWTTSTDNVGVTGYKIYRNGSTTPIQTVASTSYSDTGLSPSTTYSYQVSAYDAAGNESGKSNTASATTQASNDASGYDLSARLVVNRSTYAYAPGETVDGIAYVKNLVTHNQGGSATIRIKTTPGGATLAEEPYTVPTLSPNSENGHPFSLKPNQNYSGQAVVELTVTNSPDQNSANNTASQGISFGVARQTQVFSLLETVTFTAPIYQQTVHGNTIKVLGTPDNYAHVDYQVNGEGYRTAPGEYEFWDHLATPFILRYESRTLVNGNDVFTFSLWFADTLYQLEPRSVSVEAGDNARFRFTRTSGIINGYSVVELLPIANSDPIKTWTVGNYQWPASNKLDFDVTVPVGASSREYQMYQRLTWSNTFSQVQCFAWASINVVNVPSDTAILSGPVGDTTEPDVAFQFTGSDNRTSTNQLEYSFRLDPVESTFGSWTTATSKNYTGLAEGHYTFYVKARDQGGTEDPTPASRSFAVVPGPPPPPPPAARSLKVVDATIERGATGTVQIELEAQGDENAVGFSLAFDPALLTYQSAALGPDATGALLNVNSSQAGSGRLGIGLAMSPGQAFPSGTLSILTVTFAASAGEITVTTPVTFGDQPITREIVDVAAETLTGTYTDGTVALQATTPPPPPADPTITSITPNSGTDDGAVNITNLAGSNFASGATVRLTQAGQSDINATNVTIVSSAQITCTFDLTGVNGGQWDVVVTNPSGQSGTLANGFTVQPATPPPPPPPADGVTVVSITPSSGTNDGSVNITNLAGTNFESGATVGLTRTGEADIVATSVTVVSSTQITCTLNLTGAAEGEWNVTVTNPNDESGMLTNGFTILSFPPPPPPAARIVRVVDATIQRGAIGAVQIEIEAQGDENALGFSLVFDPALLTYQSAVLGVGATGASLNVNNNQAGSGRLGIGLAKSPGQTFAAGTLSILTVTFAAMGGDTTVMTPVTFGDQPITREIVDVTADTLTGTYTDGTVALIVSTNTDNPPPMISSILPARGTNDGSVTITDLKGTNFANGASVMLQKSGENNIVATNVVVVNAGLITCVFNLADAAVGPWSVTVVNPDGQSDMLQNTFIVGYPAPTVLSVTPTSSFNNGLATVSIAGTAFRSGANVTLTRDQQPAIETVSVQSIAPTQILCTFDLTDRPAGRWNVVVRNDDGQVGALTNGFEVENPPPILTGVSPTTAPNGGDIVSAEVSGANFMAGATVRLTRSGEEDVFASDVVTVSSSGIVCSLLLVSRQAGTWDVVVANRDGQTSRLPDGFTVTVPSPTVTGITPSEGLNNASLQISEVRGSSFQTGAIVRLIRTGQADIVGTSVAVTSASKMSCDVDLTGKAVGTWSVVVTNPDGSQGTLANGFTVRSASVPPTVTGISPSMAPDTAPVQITNLSGTGFQPVASVKLTRVGQPDIVATNVSVINSTQIRCTFDITAKPTGQWNVVVVNLDGLSATLANGFTIASTVPPPPPPPPIATVKVESITPASGLNNGSLTGVTVRGSGFESGVSVRLTRTGESDVVATNVFVVDTSTISCALDIAGRSPGIWDVVVTIPNGESGTLPNAFTVVGAVTHDVAVTRFLVNPNPVSAGQTITLSVILRNQGTASENGLVLRILSNGQSLRPSIPVSTLTSGQELSGDIPLRIPRRAALGDYFVTAQLDPVVGETNLLNNAQTVKVRVE